MSNKNTLKSKQLVKRGIDEAKRQRDPFIGVVSPFDPKTFLRIAAADKRRIARENAAKKKAQLST